MNRLNSAVILPYLLLIIIQYNNAEENRGVFCFDDNHNCYFRQGETIAYRLESDEAPTEERETGRVRRHAIRRYRNLSNIWKDGEVNYYFDYSITLNTKRRSRSVSLMKEFDRAMKAWQQDTCVNFKKVDPPFNKTAEKMDVLRVTAEEAGCASHPGRLGGEQPLILGNGCESFAHIAHELGHALGLYHTMTRYDRDNYVTVKPETMEEKYRVEFKIQTNKTNQNFGIGYDYGSIMHYPSMNAFSNYRASMIPRDKRYLSTMGSEMISFVDLWLINKLYSCEDQCAGNATVDCKHGGFPHPRNCSRCLCPGGYGGDDCTKRPNDGCGKELNAEKHWKREDLTLQNPDANKYLDGYKKCHYWIKSPSDKRIQVKFRTDYFQAESHGCVKAGVEIKANENQTLTGYRLCSEDYDETLFNSKYDLVPVITYTREFFANFAAIEYRYVERRPVERRQQKQ